MSTSFLLKDASGRVWGYLVQCDKTIKCRMNRRLDEPAELLCMCGDGTWESFSAPSDEKEQLWERRCSRITGAAVIQNEELLLDTGKEALHMAKEIIRRKEEEKKTDKRIREKLPVQIEQDTLPLPEERKRQPDIGETHRWPQR